MISVFISVGFLHKRQTTIKPRKLLINAAVWCGQGTVPPAQKILHIMPGNAKFLCILLASVVTIICGHRPIGRHGSLSPP